MINGRSSHAICYLNNSIYLIGGFDHNGNNSRLCERLDLDTMSCAEIAPLNIPSANSCAVQFNNEYILRIGGYL